MRRAFEGSASPAGRIALAATLLLSTAALLAGGGSGDGGIFWIGSAAIVGAAALAVAVLLGRSERVLLDRAGLLAVALFTAYVVWNGASILWSAQPDRSWDYFNRALVYGCFLALGLFASAAGPRLFAAGLSAALGLLVVVALLAKALPVLELDDGRRARLNEPVGYWNTLALLCAMAVPLALWTVTRARVRAGGVLLLFGALVALLLTGSRGALLLAGGAALAWLWLRPDDRFESAAALAAGAVPAVAVAGLAFTRSGLVEDGRPRADRVADGAWLLVALVLGAALAVGIWIALERLELPPERRRRLLRVGAAAAGAAVVTAVAVLVVAGGPEDSEAPGERLASASTGNRFQWWEEASRGFAHAPLAGNGAGSFQVTHRRYRDSGIEVREPHSLPLQLLTETGLVGLALFGGFAVAAGVGVVRGVRALPEPERAAGVALALGPALFLAGTLFDIHWDLVAASAPAFAVVGLLLGRGVGGRSRDPLRALVVAGLAAACLYSLAAPWLADRRVSAAYDAIADGDLATAVDRASSARSLNPLSLEPLFALGYVEFARGQFDRARDYYARAVEVQPESREAWFQLGQLEYEVERYQDAYQRFNRMYALDPHGPDVEWVQRARCRVNPTGC
jgi:O-Antigen ligase/Tetratricopeptide repeat